MLKTLNTKSVEPRKGVIGVSGGGKNRTELISKHEVDGVDDGSGRSNNFDRKFYPAYNSHTIHLDTQDELIN